MNLLITGATGFIGSACVREALARGHRVAGLVRRQTLRSSPKLPPGPVTWIEGDLADPDWAALAKFQADSCLHTAWVATPGEYLTSPANRDFLAWSISFLSRLAQTGMQHCVALGTCIEYASAPGLLNEETSPVAPASLYAQCKDRLRRELERAPFDTCWARIFYPYGPGEDPRRLASSIIQRTLNAQDIILNTPDSTKDYIHIDDVACALVIAAERKFCGILNVGTGAGVTIRQIAETIAGILVKAPRITMPASIVDPYPCVVANNVRLSNLGWKQRVSFADGLTKLVKHLTS